MIFFESAAPIAPAADMLQAAGDAHTLYILIASLVLALVAFVILMRHRF